MDTQYQSLIARTGFFVSLVSYAGFWALDLMRPGFVSRFFSVHVFLMGLLLFGLWWGATVEEYEDRTWIQHVVMVMFGMMLAMILWNVGEDFGSGRVVVAGIALATPSLIWRLMKYK